MVLGTIHKSLTPLDKGQEGERKRFSCFKGRRNPRNRDPKLFTELIQML